MVICHIIPTIVCRHATYLVAHTRTTILARQLTCDIGALRLKHQLAQPLLLHRSRHRRSALAAEISHGINEWQLKTEDCACRTFQLLYSNFNRLVKFVLSIVMLDILLAVDGLPRTQQVIYCADQKNATFEKLAPSNISLMPAAPAGVQSRSVSPCRRSSRTRSTHCPSGQFLNSKLQVVEITKRIDPKPTQQNSTQNRASFDEAFHIGAVHHE